MNRPQSPELLALLPIVGIVRKLEWVDIEFIAEHMVEGGLTTLEITMNTPGAEKIIGDLRKKYSGRLLLGAGTVCTLSDLQRAIDSGAEYIVTPVLVEEVIEMAVKKGVPIFPGAFTPSEIFRAWSLGATMVKVFPAGIAGPGYLKDVLAPLDNVKLMPSGGVSIDNFTDYLASGAAAVGIGSNLFPKELVQAKNGKGLTEFYVSLKQKYQSFIQKQQYHEQVTQS